MNDDLEQAALQQRVQGLPQTLQPDPSLWDGIEARIGASETPVGRSLPVAPKLRWPVAAITLLGVALALLAVNLPGERQVADSQPQEPVARESFAQEHFVNVQVQTQMQDQMHQLLDAQLQDLPDAVRNTVVQNLAIISAARAEIRKALEQNPDNPLLHSLYRNSYANERTLLKDVEAMARQSKRRTQL